MSDELSILLVEDNPGDARLIRELLREGSELAERAGRSEGMDVEHVERLDAALERLGASDRGDASADADGAGSEGAAATADGEAAAAATDDGEAAAAAAGASEGAGAVADAGEASAAADDAGGEQFDPADAAEEQPDEEDGRPDGGVGAVEPAGAGPSHGVDVVLLDLDLPDSAGLETLSTVVDATELLPVVVLTGLSDRDVGIRAIEQGAQDYLVKDEVTPDLLARSVHYALERSRQERRRERRREQLAALNRHNRIAQDVTHAVIGSDTREELERAVCERLVADDGYRFAWFGEVDRGTSSVSSRVAAGDGDGYVGDVTITTDDAATGSGPAGRAVETGEVQVVADVRTDPSYEPWREAALERDFRSAAAIPIAHEELLYGVLNVYAETPRAFSEAEVSILGRLGDVVGHAISALERREALVSDVVRELTFRVEDVVSPLAAATADHEGSATFDSLIETEGTVLAYGEVTGVPQAVFREAADDADGVTDCRILGGDGDQYDVELATTVGTDLLAALSTHGGRVAAASLDDGEASLLVQFPRGRDTRRLIELVEEHCPGAQLQAQRTRERASEDDGAARVEAWREQLTDRQWTALETAHRAGHFEWPRETSGEELAERLDVSPATFHEHLRSAERKVFEQLLEGE